MPIEETLSEAKKQRKISDEDCGFGRRRRSIRRRWKKKKKRRRKKRRG